MRLFAVRLAGPVLVGAAVFLGAPAAAAATGVYESGDVSVAVPDPGVIEHPITVPDGGPVADVAVWVRLDHPNDDDLELSLVAPDGTTVVLARHRGGDGQNFGAGSRDCNGSFTIFRDRPDVPPIADEEAPFEGEVGPDEVFAALRGKDAKGTWKLQIEDDIEEDAGTLFCWRLAISREEVEARVAESGRVRAELSFREVESQYSDLRLKIFRRDTLALDRRPRSDCGGSICAERPASDEPVHVRDLDRDGEPEVLLDLYSGGAHCCTFTFLYRYVPDRGYVKLVHFWGNVGYRIGDLDRDGRPEFVSSDDRFAYVLTSYAAWVNPVQVWRYETGALVDVTRRYPGFVRRDASRLWRAYLATRRKREDVRGILGAYLAEKVLLGEARDGWRRLREAVRRGDLSRPKVAGAPSGNAYLKALRKLLIENGYVSKAKAVEIFPL